MTSAPAPGVATIRAADPADIPEIAAIYAHAVRHGTASFELEPPDEGEMGARMQAIVGGGYPYLVAERGDRVVGYAYAASYRPRRAYRWTVEDSVYVAPSAQGAGVGRALLAALVEECAARGFRQMLAVIGDTSNAASIALHARLGFRHVGTFEAVGRKHGRWLGSVLMQRPLGDGDDTPPPAEI